MSAADEQARQQAAWLMPLGWRRDAIGMAQESHKFAPESPFFTESTKWPNIEFEESMSCAEKFRFVQQLGFDGAYALIPMRHWHMFSQIFGHLILTTPGTNVTNVMHVLLRMAEFASYKTGAANAFGYVHGATWYIVSKSDMLDHIFGYIPVSLSFAHGFGHGFLLRHGSHSQYSPCDEHPEIEGLEQVSAAVEDCHLVSNYSRFRTGCISGVYDAMFEHNSPGSDIFRSSDVFFPCWSVKYPAYCFHYFFYYMSDVTKVPSIPDAVRSVRRTAQLHHILTSNVSDLCARDHADSDQTAACIWGLTFTLFTLFDSIWTTMNATTPAVSVQQACLNAGILGDTFPAASCPTYFFPGSGLLPGKSSEDASSVVAWCRLITPPLYFDKNMAHPRDHQRQACESWESFGIQSYFSPAFLFD